MVSCILFNYRNKVDVSIHTSWLNSPLLWIIRTVSQVILIIRFAMYYDTVNTLCSYQLIFLTFYGFVLTIIYFSLVTLHLPLEKLLFKESKVIKFIGECINMIYEATFAIEMVVTLLFWSLLAGGQDLWGFENLGMHLIPLLLLLADFIFHSYAFPIRHLAFTFLLGAIYIVINQVHACPNNPVYKGTYECGDILVPVGAFAILAVTHVAGHFVWKLWRRHKFEHKKNELEGRSILLQS